ncbi:hypothetical protein PAECIP111893_02353 [Paenibacillus plantiphilus]|uniref:ABC transmembrane type-1 domain-containing protein n=1 Tax=Paenibacillus plantiphilus TaxID=2905650 RepID=A0ABM9C6N8_9BACL|nr:ABC transporter permease subunit [Paenibacillus plantiphilus]CAH1205463.1 hypothetical protein PAECIP111893_02353 [Paenibacillus plantiphilus]
MTLLLWILVLGPLVAVLTQILIPGFFFGNRQFGQVTLLFDVFRRPLWQHALQNSLVLSISTAVMGTLIGASLAIFRSRWHFPTARWLDVSVWLLFVTPSFIIAQGWVLFAAKNGVAAQLLGADFVTSFIFHPIGLTFIMVLSKFPLAYLAVHAALEWQVESLSHAARLTGASPVRTWFTVHIPLLKPAIGSGMALVFMDAIGDFGITATVSAVYRFPTLPYTIYSAIYTSPIRFDMAGVLSFYLIIIIMLAIVFQFYMMKGSRYDSLTAGAVRTRQKKIASKGWIATTCNVLFLFLAIGIPIGCTVFTSFVHEPSKGLAMDNWTVAHYVDLFTSNSLFVVSLLRSIKIALIAALAGLLLGAMIAYVLIFTQFRFKHLLESMSLISLAVPGVVLGIGYIFVWNQKWLESYGLLLYGKPSILILAAIAGTIPIITRIISGTMATVPRTMLDVAQLQGVALSGRIFSILLPLCKSALVTAALSAFGASMFDLAVNSILFPPSQPTLPVMINKAFENLKFGYAAAATMLGGSIVTTLIITARWLLNLNMRRKYR